MSKGFNKILDFMKLNDGEYDDYEEFEEDIDEEEDEIEETPKKKKAFSKSFSSSRAKNTSASHDDYDDYDDLEMETPSRKKSQAAYTTSRKSTSSYGRTGKIVPMRANVTSRGMEVCVSKPIDFNSCQEISDIILSGRAAIINFDAVTSQEAQRIIDFVSGACYAINGSAKQISDSIVVVTPEDIDITGDLQEMASSSGVAVPAFGYSEEDD